MMIRGIILPAQVAQSTLDAATGKNGLNGPETSVFISFRRLAW